ncbi:MAG: hypothetical protein RLZZ522_1733 [Verrucomicrobiota bacterium]
MIPTIPTTKESNPTHDQRRQGICKGRVGCLVVFVVLLLLGGVLGLIVNWIYQKGRRDADGDDR